MEKQPIEKVIIEKLANPDKPSFTDRNLVITERISNPKPKQKAKPRPH
jgi:hypothetical protein